MAAVAVIGLGYVGLPLVVEADVPTPVETTHIPDFGPLLGASKSVGPELAHRQYPELAADDICRKVIRNGCFVDVKSAYDRAALARYGLNVWRL